MPTRPHQLQSAISGAFDAVLARRPGGAATVRQARHRADFERVWARLGYPDDPALKRRTFAQLRPQFARWDAKDDLGQMLAAADSRRRLEAASALGRAQGQTLAQQEHSQTLMDGLNRRVQEIRGRKRRLRPQGPIRLF